MKLVALAMALAALTLTGSATAANRHVVETAVDGNVEADFSYDYNAQSYRFTNPHLTIRRGGAVLLDEDLKPVTSYSEVDPARYFNHQKSVAVRNLDVDPEPEIVLHLWWGGAHCCWYTQVYRFDQMANHYVLTRHIFGNADYRARDLDHDGRPEFMSGDDRFAYSSRTSRIRVGPSRSGAIAPVDSTTSHGRSRHWPDGMLDGSGIGPWPGDTGRITSASSRRGRLTNVSYDTAIRRSGNSKSFVASTIWASAGTRRRRRFSAISTNSSAAPATCPSNNSLPGCDLRSLPGR